MSVRLLGAILATGAGLALSFAIGSRVEGTVAPPTLDGAAKLWIKPGATGILPSYSEYAVPGGTIGMISAAGPTQMKGHPFFEPIGKAGRACVTCHQPADAMSISTATLKHRWDVTQGKDPVFAAVDGANCPNLPMGKRASHALLLDKGLFRIPLSWPPKGQDGKAITPEFSIEVVSDPTGCNTDKIYGITGQKQTVSVYRRPRMSANLTHIVETSYQFKYFSSKTGLPLATDPDTKRPTTMAMMSDARQLSLRRQAFAALEDHMQTSRPITDAEQQRLEQFQRGVYLAKVADQRGGKLVVEGGPPALGPWALQKKVVGALGDNLNNPVWGSFEMWRADPERTDLTDVEAYRASVARGHDVFFIRPFWLRDAAHMNNLGLGNPTLRTCSTCHNQQLTGIDTGPGWMDIGTSNKPWADPAPDLPLFRIQCSPKSRPHPYLGRDILTHDPGRALITGKCIDVGAFNMHQFRGLSARAPYFTNGGKQTVRDIVDFYDRRFEMKLTAREATDLTNFLESL